MAFVAVRHECCRGQCRYWPSINHVTSLTRKPQPIAECEDDASFHVFRAVKMTRIGRGCSPNLG